jgi:HSP20 family molecular chaperone IbpA
MISINARNLESLNPIFRSVLADFDRHVQAQLEQAQQAGQTSDKTPAPAAQINTPHDLLETGDAFVLRLAVPGVKADALEIALEGRKLSIKGNIPNLKAEGDTVLFSSLPVGAFHRVITVPQNVGEDISADLEDGILTLTVPKPAVVQPKKIEVRQAGNTVVNQV